MGKPILILTHAKDDCASLVAEKLRKMTIPFVRFNTEEFHARVKLKMDMNKHGKFSGAYIFPDIVLPFEDVSVIWNRRVHKPNPGDELQYEPELRRWMEDEAFEALNVSFTMFTCPVVNPWENNEKIKFNKMIQMQRAASLGLEIPDSCITNDLVEISRFWDDVDRDMIFKKIKKGVFYFKNGKRIIVHTNKIPPERMTGENLNRMRFSPVFLQRHISKKYDVRSIVVGERVFSVAIHSQDVEEGKVDFRKAAVLGKINKMKHEFIDLGLETNKKLIAFTKSFGLTFGAIDSILTSDDRVVFLEDNPNGQWGWLEVMTGINISGAVADHLSELRSNIA